MKNYKLCHCEHSEVIFWIDESNFEIYTLYTNRFIPLSLKSSARKLTDCFTTFAMTGFTDT